MKHGMSEGNAMIMTNDGKLYDILSDLLINAITYISKGSVCFEFTREQNDLLFKAIDTGCGIPKDKHRVIFDRFGQVHAYLNGPIEGVGFGLAITKAYVKMLKGGIKVNSALEKERGFRLLFGIIGQGKTNQPTL